MGAAFGAYGGVSQVEIPAGIRPKWESIPEAVCERLGSLIPQGVAWRTGEQVTQDAR